MMKRLTTLFALLVAVGGVLSVNSASAQNRVLIEEFTSSTCPPCAATDPFMKQVEADRFNDVCVLKWHQNFPAPGDPSYVMYTFGQNRLNYYGVTGIPGIVLNGNQYFNPGYGVKYVEDSITNVKAAMQNYYTMSVTQTIVADSFIAYVTVKTGPTAPAATDLRMVAVVAERFAQYKGSNGLPSHDYIARWSMPALDGTGAIPASAAFNQAPNTTQTYRYASLIKSTWNRTQLMVVSYIQSAGTAGTSKKEIFQSIWNEPSVDVTANSGLVLVGDPSSKGSFTVKNNSAASEKIFLNVKSSNAPAAYSFTVGGTDADGSITLAAGASKNVTVSGATTGLATTVADFGLYARTSDSIGVGGAVGTAFGKDIKVAIVDAGAGAYSQTSAAPTSILASLTKLGYTAAIIGSSTMDGLADWTKFSAVIWDAGLTVGVYTNTGDTGSIANYITNGGKFVLISSQMPGVYLNAGLSQYLNDNFDIDAGTYDGTTGFVTLTGVNGDPIGNALTSAVANQPNTQTIISHDGNAFPCFTDDNGDTVMVRATIGKAKTVFASFEIGNISVSGGKRDTVVRRIMNWLNGTAAVSPIAEATNTGISVAPNPFSGSTNVSYNALGSEQNVTMTVYDVLGRQVASLTPVRSGSNVYTSTFNGADLATGTYHVIVRSSLGMKQIPVMITR